MIYLCSPYSSPDPAVQEQRFREVCRIAAEMMREGLVVFSPIAHTKPIADAGDLPHGWEFWERYDREMIGLCSEVIVLKMDGWEQSKGIAAEVEIARQMGKPVSFREV